MAKLYVPRSLLMIGAVVSVFDVGLLPVSVAAKDLKITVQVDADSAGNQLTYRWRSTDGQIKNQDEPFTEWTLPPGPGIHFAYVLVSNGKGGYTERRIAVNTDGLSAARHHPRMNLIPPAASASSSVPFRDWLGGGVGSSLLGGVKKQFKVALPDIEVNAFTLRDDPSISERTNTSLMGDFTLQNFSPRPDFSPKPLDVNDFGILCTLQGIDQRIDLGRCFGVDASFASVPDEVIDIEANETNHINTVPTDRSGGRHPEDLTWFTGTALLPGGSACGTENEFFGVTRYATAELVDDFTNLPIPGYRVRANSWGQFSIAVTGPVRDMHTRVVVRCEDADPVSPTGEGTKINGDPKNGVSDSKDFDVVTIGSAPPVVRNMLVTPATIPAKFDDPTARPALPSDIVPPRPAKFLAMKGLDTRLSGCLYYKTIGVVKDCDTTGENFLVGAVSFEDWKRTVKIDQYAPRGTEQYTALFVNRVDLNLTREHHSVSYGPTATAGYVCNHLGPQPTAADATGLFPPAAEMDRVIDNAAAGRDLVACVAMDYSIARGVNDGLPFTRFLIFGPSGELLPSVNLDGRGEKFVPGTCVVCHGGNKYAGKFPEDGTGTADLEAHFLPFDIGSFEFHSSRPQLTQAAQEEAIYHLNQNVLKADPNQAEMAVIKGWYASGHTQNLEFSPFGLNVPDAFRTFYRNVIAKSCRTCHIAQRDQDSIRDLNFSKFMVNQGKPGELNPDILKALVCGQTNDLLQAYAMPNSAVTFDLFWLSRGSSNDQPQQVGSKVGGCTNPPPN
jgi:hypothetical protein